MLNKHTSTGYLAKTTLHASSAASVSGKSSSVQVPHRINLKYCGLRSPLFEPSVYGLLLEYCQTLWPDLSLVGDISSLPGLPFISKQNVTMLNYIIKDGTRYGSVANKRTKADSTVFVKQTNGSIAPAEILHLFLLDLRQPSLPKHACALIQRLRFDERIMSAEFPWNM